MSAPTTSDVLRFVWSYWRLRPLLFGVIFATVSAAVVIDVTIPVYVGRLIDAVAGQRPLEDVLTTLGMMFGLWAVLIVVRDASFRMWMHFAAFMMGRIVPDVFARVQRFSTEWHASNFAGRTIRQISRGMWAYDSLADALYVGFWPSFLVVVTASVLVGARWPIMGLYMCVALVVYLGASVVLAARYIAPANEAANDADSAIGAVLSDAITSNAVVKGFAAEAREDALVAKTMQTWRRLAVRGWLRWQNTLLLQMVITFLLRGGLLGMAIWQWHSGRATAGDIVFVITTYLVADGYLIDIGRRVREAQQGVNELQDLVAFLRTDPQVADHAEAVPMRMGSGAVRFEDVTFAYDHQGAPIYEGLDLSIAGGEKVALVGRTGSGKSTLAKLLQRLYDPQEGRILIDGQDVAHVTQESLRRAIALVPQDPALFHRSLGENIGYARPEATDAEIERAAAQAHADGFIDALPRQYETLVGERGVKLSGGERQRVALARAFLADAPILVLDEATSSLDSVTESAIEDATSHLIEGRTTIVIAHRLSTVRMVDRILVFDNGRIVEEGRHDDLVRREGGLYRRLYEEQVGKLRMPPAADAAEAPTLVP